jgi:hypothetical protein
MKKKYKPRSYTSLDDWFNHWILGYLVTADPFEANLRLAIVKDEFNSYVKTITGKELPRQFRKYCECPCHDGGEFVNDCESACDDCYEPRETHLIGQENENVKPHHLCNGKGGNPTWSVLEYLDSKNRCKKCYQIYIYASRNIQTS